MEKYFSKTTEEALNYLKVSKEGLSTRQAKENLSTYGFNELNQKKQIERLEDFNKYEKNDYLYYLHIVSIVDNWMKELLPDELEIITLRNFEKMSFDLISIHVGYANHSSIIRKYRKIIDKVRKMNNE